VVAASAPGEEVVSAEVQVAVHKRLDTLARFAAVRHGILGEADELQDGRLPSPPRSDDAVQSGRELDPGPIHETADDGNPSDAMIVQHNGLRQV